MLPTLLRELSELQSTTVLEGSYDLRLARQDYHLAKQDRVLHHLLSQKSRHEFLIRCFVLEERRVRYTHNLLEAIQQEYANACEAWNKRMVRTVEILMIHAPLRIAFLTLWAMAFLFSHLEPILAFTGRFLTARWNISSRCNSIRKGCRCCSYGHFIQ